MSSTLDIERIAHGSVVSNLLDTLSLGGLEFWPKIASVDELV